MAGQPGPQLYSSPTVFRTQGSPGRIYIGANTGVFYAIDEATGAVVWQRFLGFVRHNTCGKRGFASTATVAADPVSGQPTVYVAAPDGYLYALNAVDGSILWREVVALPSTEVNDYYNWGSPTVADGHVFMGVSSQCDNPLIRGGVKEYDQASGTPINTYFTVPAGTDGGSVWSSIAANESGRVAFASTGNTPPGSDPGDSFSIVRFDTATGQKLDVWTALVTHDRDFGASPVLFRASFAGIAVPMVGACNKNGVFYALRQARLSHGPVWSTTVSEGECLAAAVWDSHHLFVSGSSTIIDGTAYAGSVSELDPTDGSRLWQIGLPAPVIGTPTMDGAGVLAAPTYGDGVYLLDSTDGSILGHISPGTHCFAQPVFADGYLFVAPVDGGLTAYRVTSP